MPDNTQPSCNPKGRKPGRDLRWARNEVKQWLNGNSAAGTPEYADVYRKLRQRRYERALALIAAHKLANS